jgi:hypothetical protein
MAIRHVTRIFRFAARLSERTFSAEEVVNVAITLTGTKSRVIITREDQERLMGWYIATAPSLQHVLSLKREDLRAAPDHYAVQAMLWIFERFNWPRVSEEILSKNQTRIFSGR